MAPKLYMAYASPPARSVLMCAKAIDLELELKEVSIMAKEHLTPEYLKINPQHTVPTLVDDDGFIIWDSHAIMPYLVGKYGKDNSLYPKDLKKRAVIDQRLHFDSNVIFPRAIAIIKSVVYEGAKQIKESDKKPLLEAYDMAEKFLEGNEWVAGNTLTIADFSFASSITSFSKIVALDEAIYPRINSWLRKIEQTPAYEANVIGLNAFDALIKMKLGI